MSLSIQRTPQRARHARKPPTSTLDLLAASSPFFFYLAPVLRSKKRRLLFALDLVIVLAMLVNPFMTSPSFASSSPPASAATSAPSTSPSGPAPVASPSAAVSETPATPPSGTTSPLPSVTVVTVTATASASTPLPTATVTTIGTGTTTGTTTTATATSTTTGTVIGTTTGTPTGTPIGTPVTPAPTVTLIPDTNYQEQAIDNTTDDLLEEVDALPTPARGITGTLVNIEHGGKITSQDGGLTLGLRPGIVPGDGNLFVRVDPRTFQPGDPRATHNGQPLAYTYELTATHEMTGEPVGHFSFDAVLIFNINTQTLAEAGIEGLPRVYTYDEEQERWVEVLSRWDPETSQLVATTPHFSLYSVGSGFDKVNNYLPSVNSFEVDLQSGTASTNYPINLPPGPGGFGPRVALSYNSGNVDRVDIAQQGSSSVGWGWSLSGSYVAATQHHFPEGSGCGGGTQGYHPWTVSIASDGVSGDLVKAADGYWHTSIESFARIEYISGNDTWEAWSKDGTHYSFAGKALDWDDYNKSSGLCSGSSVLRPYKWMLTSAEDVHGNTINYTYRYEADDINNTLYSSPITTGRTKAVYPYDITWGASADRLKVAFNIVDRHIGGVFDANQADEGAHLYQTRRIDRIDVNRKQSTSGTYSLLRSYYLDQDYTIQITMDGGAHTYRHLTLNGITLKGNDNSTQLPGTTFVYNTTSQAFTSIYDQGHLYQAKNGYGGEVRYYYDAAGSDVHSAYRRVRAKRILDGISDDATTPHNVKYAYDYRGAHTNTSNISADISLTNSINNPDTQFRGFTWVRVQDPAGEVVDHYFNQDDIFKAKEWRTQVGKTDTYNDTMSAPTPTATVTSNGNWNISGTVRANLDPSDSNNKVWKVSVGASMQRTATPTGTATTTPTITAYLRDGADVTMRFNINGAIGFEEDQDTDFVSNWLLTSTTGSNYWGLQVYRKEDVKDCSDVEPYTCLYKNYAKIVWQINGVAGSRDLSPESMILPKEKRDIWSNTWQVVRLHTAPDGRFVMEQYHDDFSINVNDGNRRTNLYGDYIIIKSGDPKDGSGGVIPSMPTGLNWTFKHEVTAGNNSFNTLVDDYTETRTVFSESDTVFEEQNNSQNTASAYSATPLAGSANNCRGMLIHFLPVTESLSTIFGTGSELGTYKQTKSTFTYDTLYGDQTAAYDYGDLDTTGDERSTHMGYVQNTGSGHWLLGKLAWTNSYKTITGNVGGSNMMAQSVNYYDGNASSTATPTNGDLTKARQVGLIAGSTTGQNSDQQFAYDGYGNQISVTDPNGNPSVDTEFDPYYHSFPMTITTNANSAMKRIGYDFTLDAANIMTDENGLVTQSLFDVFGRPQKSWVVGYGNAFSPNEIYQFNDAGVSSITPPFYISYTVKLDDAGPSYTYGMRWFDGRGRVLQDVTPRDSTHTVNVDTYYNILSQVVSSTLPYEASYSYPPAYATATSQPNVSKLYDGIGRTTVITNPDGTHLNYDYSYLQWVYSTDEEADKLHKEQTDMLGRLIHVEDVDISGAPTPAPTMKVDYSYNLLNQLTSVTRDQGGSNASTSYMEYDGLGRKSVMTDTNMGRWDYLYDNAGNLTEQFDALCTRFSGCTDPTHHIYFAYDNMNRIQSKYYGSDHQSNGIPDVRYYYDNAFGDASTYHSIGKLRRAEVTLQGQGSDKANGHDYKYDDRGLLSTEAITTALSTRTYTQSYTYDAAGRLLQTTYPDPESAHEIVTNVYNVQGMGLPYSLLTNKDSVNPVFSASYNVRGQLTQILQGSSPYNNAVTTSYTYDDSTTKRGWLTNTAVTVGSAPTSVLNLTMQYSNNGNITQVAQSVGGTSTNPTFTNTYTYDAMDRLATAGSSCTGCTGSSLFAPEEYTFDSLSRMTVRRVNNVGYQLYYTNTAHIDAPTFYAYPQTSYSYDADGNQLSRTTGGQTQTRTFDPENRVTVIVSGTFTTRYIYDANGGRVIKGVQNTASTGDGPGAGAGVGAGAGAGPGMSLPSTGNTQRTLYFGQYEEELPTNQTVTWASLVASTAYTSSNILHKTGTNSAWDAGAISTQSIASSSGGGYVSVVADATDRDRLFGLGNSNVNASDSDVEYGLRLKDNGTLEVLEGGTSRGNMGAYSVGDVLKVAVVSAVVKYYRNDTLLYSSKITPSYPLYLDTSIYTPGANLVGALLCVGSACVASPTTPPYTSYYSFGGKLVGMRRANYSASGSNGQFRVVGDHLGSTTLVVDTANPPNVVQRQYHKPYGETAFQYTASSTGSASLTNVGYTGQRTDEDSTGLMFYNARVYDPVLSLFISVDSIISEPKNARNHNRYSYVDSNPILNVDPTGHAARMPDELPSSSCSAGNLDCTIDQFDNMSADDRIAWLRAFSSKWGYGDTFNSIIAVIEWFRDGILKMEPGHDWVSAADAGVLFAIQAGQAQLSNDMGCPVKSPNGPTTQSTELMAAGKSWAAFFKEYHALGGNWDAKDNKLLRLYGRAEQDGETFGKNYAERERKRPGDIKNAILEEFLRVGDAARAQQRAGDKGIPGIHQNMPTNHDTVYLALFAFEAEWFREHYHFPTR